MAAPAGSPKDIDATTPQPPPVMPLAEKYTTRYDPGRDRFYGLEYDPYTYTGKTHD